MTKEEEQLLLETPLNQLNRRLFSFYFSAAEAGDTASEIREMKYFLPRMMEMLADRQEIYEMQEVVFQRLQLNEEAHWLQEEKTLFELFALTYFDDFLILRQSQPNDEITSMLIMFGNAGLDLKPLLQLCCDKKSLTALLHLYDLVVCQMTYAVKSAAKLNNPFTTKDVDRIVIEWLTSSETKKCIRKNMYHHIEKNSQLTTEEFDCLLVLDEYLDVFYKNEEKAV